MTVTMVDLYLSVVNSCNDCDRCGCIAVYVRFCSVQYFQIRCVFFAVSAVVVGGIFVCKGYVEKFLSLGEECFLYVSFGDSNSLLFLNTSFGASVVSRIFVYVGFVEWFLSLGEKCFFVFYLFSLLVILIYCYFLFFTIHYLLFYIVYFILIVCSFILIFRCWVFKVEFFG